LFFVAEAVSNILQDEDFWNDLFDSIEAGRVIPVIGEGAITFGEEDQRLLPWLAKKLAGSLQLSPANIEGNLTLNEVVCMWLLKGERRNTVYTRLNRILKDECPQPGPTLLNLASVTAFNLYLTTSFDPLLERALNIVRFANQPLTESLSFGEKQDIPFRRKELAGANVYHVFGKASALPNFAVWEEDTLDFMCDLHRLLNVSNMKNLACDLKEHSLLVLGLNFSDWLVRFFMRIARQEKLSTSTNVDYLADGPAEAMPQSMVLFFGGANKNVQVVPCRPSEFSAELARQWKLRNPEKAGGAAKPVLALPPAPEMPRGAIFISYAREDEEAVKRLKAGLEQHGCLVWYDRERLKPGVNWHNALEDEVKERCSLFLSVVSRTTETEFESYFHLERNWAEYRTEFFSSGEEFYVSVVIDDTPMPFQREPRRFRKVQATRLLSGEVDPAFGEHLRQLQALRRATVVRA
jgi:hypothetical protein